MNADGSNQHRVYYTQGTSGSPSWSPDGRSMVFANDKEDNRSGNFEVFIIEPDTAEPERRLTFRRRYDVSPVFSSSGKRIAFASNTDGNYEIYVMNADGTGLLRLTRDAADDIAPHWSPDETKIVFCSNREGRSAIYELEVPR
jgi:TolB protein